MTQNVKVVQALLIIVIPVVMIEYQDLNPLVHALMDNTQIMKAYVKTVHSDVNCVLIPQIPVMVNVLM